MRACSYDVMSPVERKVKDLSRANVLVEKGGSGRAQDLSQGEESH